MNCKECKFWYQTDWDIKGNAGECRRYPPTRNGATVVTGDDYFCGEFSPREEESRGLLSALRGG